MGDAKGAALRTCLLIALVGPTARAAGGAKANEPFDYFANSFSVIALKDYAYGARVTGDNEILLDQQPATRGTRSGYKGRLQVQFGRHLVPLGRKPRRSSTAGCPSSCSAPPTDPCATT